LIAGEAHEATAATRAPLLMTKLHPVPRRDQTIARERLIDRLREGGDAKLTLVAAPAGSGKTTLLGTWRELEAATKPVAWLTIDERDNDPVVLWSYVIEALRGVCPALDVDVPPERVGPERIVDAVLPRLVNGLAEVGHAALILDDFHRLSSGPARDSVAWFVEHAPPTLQLVLATRTEPALPVAALRAHGTLLELRADELGFTPAEADMLLNDRLQLGIEPDDVGDLVERTEGWPAGLYLAALSLRAVEDRRGFVSTFGGGSRHVVNFLVDEVLEAHDPATQSLMLRASVLERLCGSLCDAVLGQKGSDGLLEALARSNLFLLPLDDHGEWYRFHHLFAQLLRVELEHRDPGLAPTLHRRAFAWHRDQGSVTEAIEHAVEAGALDEAADLISTAWVDQVHVNRHATVLAWLERFPRERLSQESRLLLAAAWVFTLSGQRQAAAEAVAAIELRGRLDEGPLPDGFSSVEAGLATLRGLVTWGNVGAGIRNARRAAELEGPASPWRAVICLGLGFQMYNIGDLDQCDAWLRESVELARSRGQWSTASAALAFRSLAAGEAGRVDDQTLLAEEAVRLERERGFDEIDGRAHLALGAALGAQQRFEEALAILEGSLTILRSRGLPLPLVTGLLHYIAVLQAMGRPRAAADAIAEAKAILGSCPDPGILPERLASLERPPQTRRRSGDGALTARELVILRMLGGPLTERDIGRELYLSHNTIHSHTRSIYRKLGASSRSEALAHARELGLISR
jgi:LuxR family maltose regulon positive regulatory protein